MVVWSVPCNNKEMPLHYANRRCASCSRCAMTSAFEYVYILGHDTNIRLILLLLLKTALIQIFYDFFFQIIM